MKLLVLFLAFFTMAASAADISGTWKGTAETPNGTIERTFVFKVDGTKLTGETSSQFTGKSTITDGKVEGDDVTFTITAKFQDNDVKLNYKGKIKGDVINFNVQAAEGQFTIDYVAKRVS